MMPDSRLDAILEVLLAFAKQDFTKLAPVSDRLDEIDAIASGLNMLAEDLHGEVASRRELEAANRALRDAQAKLVQTEKLAAIGQLASGVAHEINNPASWVFASLEVLQQRMSEARTLLAARAHEPETQARLVASLAEGETYLSHAMDGIARIRAVAGDLRTLARADPEPTEDVHLDDVVRSACNLAKAALRQSATLVLDLRDDAVVRGSPGRLGQVVTNLLVNATQALSEGGGAAPEIRVQTRVEGSHALLAVEDTGPGVPEALREKIFEPFFTTKPAHGTGLGLSLVADLVSRHGGTVTVAAAARGGARFEVRLPRTSAQLSAPASKTATPKPKPSERSRLLIIDDEPRLLQTYALLLADAHDVVLAQGGRNALELLEQDQTFDVVLCDLQMPEVDGVAVFDRVRQLAPALAQKVIFSSGGVVQERIKRFLEQNAVPLLAKPVREETLLAAIARMRADG